MEDCCSAVCAPCCSATCYACCVTGGDTGCTMMLSQWGCSCCAPTPVAWRDREPAEDTAAYVRQNSGSLSRPPPVIVATPVTLVSVNTQEDSQTPATSLANAKGM